ncbi:hypothetical protein V8E36_003041 [Tilletia maclaganii]
MAEGGDGQGSRIRPIDQVDVHRITSAQVVLDLQTAVKEVIENALDAGATNVEVRFKDYGADSFEVIDNGSGIDPKDYEAIALKHHTSKLSTFADLQHVQTFGFRGEALSSLCALASVTMHTATQSEAPVGTVLTFEKSGKVTPGSRKQPRQRGTTVTVRDLFKSYPVRRREFEKNLKREFAKAQSVLQAYALIQKGVRMTVYNIPKSGGRKTVQMSMSANSSPSFLLSNVTDLLGNKVASTLDVLNLKLELPSAAMSRPRGKKRGRDGAEKEASAASSTGAADSSGDEEDSDASSPQSVEIVGAISKLLPTCGRTSADRQFFYINGRPWESPKIARIFNEVYRSNNTDRYPMVIANFLLPPATYDVNITPDKRTIFLHLESALQDELRTALGAVLSRYHGVFSVNVATQTTRTSQSRLPTSWQKQPSPAGEDAEGGADDDELADDAEGEEEEQNEARADGGAVRKENRSVRSSSPPGPTQERPDRRADSENSASSSEQVTRSKTDDEVVRGGAGPSRVDVPPQSPTLSSLGRRRNSGTLSRLPGRQASSPSRSRPSAFLTSSPPPESGNEDEEEAESDSADEHAQSEHTPPPMPPPPQLSSPNAAGSSDDHEELTFVSHTQVAQELTREMPSAKPPALPTPRLARSDSESLPLDIRWLQNRATARKLRAEATPGPEDKSDVRARGVASDDAAVDLARAGVAQESAAEAEAQLQRVISKSDFRQMQIVGQFNLGFIIARRRVRVRVRSWAREEDGVAERHGEASAGEADEDAYKWTDDLFIVDQHASDEKYNFERLQADTIIRSQRLIQPRRLELPASDELVAIEHEETLKKNGFELQIDEDAQAGSRLKLVAQPLSKNVSFGPKDLAELIHLLGNLTPGSAQALTMRCSKARAMFASRACRSSVMVGRALNVRQMRTILDHMGTIEQPWNCPHGRPTMRHLVSMVDANRDDEGQSSSTTSDSVAINWSAL